MEPRVAVNANPIKASVCNLYDYFTKGRDFCRVHYAKEMKEIASIDFNSLDSFRFWEEYVWCVYVGGFNSKIVAAKWESLSESYWPWDLCDESFWYFVEPILAHRAKFDGIVSVAYLLRQYRDAKPGNRLWWSEFKQDYLRSVELIQKLPFMGPVTAHHLARNIGHSTIKPDLHLVRLSRHYMYGSPFLMCRELSERYQESLAVVDLILFYTASTFGTQDIT